MKTQIIILAAGHGKRMGADLPKVLIPVKGKPMVRHILKSIELSGLCEKPVVVVGKNREMVMSELGDSYTYAIQEEQLGTGHAVLAAEELLKNNTLPIVVLNGDMPYVSRDTIVKLYENFIKSNGTITIGTVTLSGKEDWQSSIYDFGRIVRGIDGAIEKIVEKKDASEEQLRINEFNPQILCFDPKWLWENLHKLKNDNNQKEYYLTDLIGLASMEKVKISSIDINPKEALGVNTKEQLELIEKLR